MNILITGGTGLLGKALIETKNENKNILATYIGNYNLRDDQSAKYRKLDVRDKDGYRDLFIEFKPDVIIHTAGIGSPDFSEQNKELTWEINITGTKNLLDCASAFSSKFIFISSNGIYDGNAAPYDEEDEPSPINYYGSVKLAGEKITKESGIVYAVIRPILMYGWNHPFERCNIVTWALNRFRENKVVNAYSDVYINPLLALQCAEAIWKIIEKEKYETFNIGGKDRLSVYEFLKYAADVFGVKHELIRPVRQGSLEKLVKRPSDTSYNTKKMETVLCLRPLSVEEGLKIMKDKQDACG